MMARQRGATITMQMMHEKKVEHVKSPHERRVSLHRPRLLSLYKLESLSKSHETTVSGFLDPGLTHVSATIRGVVGAGVAHVCVSVGVKPKSLALFPTSTAPQVYCGDTLWLS